MGVSVSWYGTPGDMGKPARSGQDPVKIHGDTHVSPAGGLPRSQSAPTSSTWSRWTYGKKPTLSPCRLGRPRLSQAGCRTGSSPSARMIVARDPPQCRDTPATTRRRTRVQRRRRHRRRPPLPRRTSHPTTRPIRPSQEDRSTHRRPDPTRGRPDGHRHAQRPRPTTEPHRNPRRRRPRHRPQRSCTVDRSARHTTDRPTAVHGLATGCSHSCCLPGSLPDRRRHTAGISSDLDRAEDRRGTRPRLARPSS